MAFIIVAIEIRGGERNLKIQQIQISLIISNFVYEAYQIK